MAEILCVSVNDAHVMRVWAAQSGAAAAGIAMLADADSALTKALGLAYSKPEFGMLDRSQRYAMVVEDGVVARLDVEDAPGVCGLSSGEAMLEALA